MAEIIDSAQLKATAQAAKNFILDKDTQNIQTIINALNGGGSASAKTEPTLSVSEDGTITYNGDGTLGLNINSNLFARIHNNEIFAKDDEGFSKSTFTGTILASEGTNFAAKSLAFSVSK